MSQPSHQPANAPSQETFNAQEPLAPTFWRQSEPEKGFPDPLLDLIAARFRLLGEPLRLKLLAILANGERGVGELVELTGAGQPNVSKHLAALAEGGLVRRRKVGTSTLYAMADPSVLSLCDVVCAGLQERAASQARALGLAGNKWTDEPTSAPRSSSERGE